MKEIRINTSGIQGVIDLYREILQAIGAPAFHGYSIDAVVDSIVWGGIKSLEPPFRLKISPDGLKSDVRSELEELSKAINSSREEFKLAKGREVCVSIELS